MGDYSEYYRESFDRNLRVYIEFFEYLYIDFFECCIIF